MNQDTFQPPMDKHGRLLAGPYLLNPAQAIKHTAEDIRIRSEFAITLDWGIPCMDARIRPAYPGQTIGILARPQNGKTRTLLHLATRWATLAKMSSSENVILFASWEPQVTELVAQLTSQFTSYTSSEIQSGFVTKGDVMDAIKELIRFNIYLFSHSPVIPGQGIAKLMPVPSVQDLVHATQYLRQEGFNPMACFVDYMQRITPVSQNRQQSVTNDMQRLTALAKQSGMVMVIASQARRRPPMKDEIIRLPTDEDSQWTSAFEQDLDLALSLSWTDRYMTDPTGTGAVVEFEVNGETYESTPNTMVVDMWKQRYVGSSATDRWVLEVDHDTNTLSEQAPAMLPPI